MASKVGGWITATSANLSGGAAPKTVAEIPIELLGSVDEVLDDGPCPGGMPSTVIDVSNETWSIVRIGSISEEIISRTLRQSAQNYTQREFK